MDRVKVWSGVVAGLLVGFAVVFFIQTDDPVILVFGAVAAAAAWGLAVVAGRLGRAGASVRCRACSGLNPEAAKFCNACGKAL